MIPPLSRRDLPGDHRSWGHPQPRLELTVMSLTDLLARVEIALLIPPGHVVVPVEPTPEMLNAAPAREDPGEESMYATIYRAMLAAAPKVTT